MAGIIDLTGDTAVDDRRTTVNIDADAEDTDLKLAIELSLQDQPAASSIPDETRATGRNEDDADEPPSVPTGLLGLDRKAMEMERLARLKRKRGVKLGSSDPTKHSPRYRARTPEPFKSISPPPKRNKQSTMQSSHVTTTSASSASQASRGPFAFPAPEVLFTSSPSRHSHDQLIATSFRDIIAPPRPGLHLKSALFSSFIADFDWLLPHFDTQKTSFVFILHSFSAQHRNLLQEDFAGIPNVRLVMPQSLGGSGNMHSKIMLLFFKSDTDHVPEICRLIVTSANLTPADWGIGNVMENIAMVVDLPSTNRSSSKVASDASTFRAQLAKQLEMMEVPQQVILRLEGFEFSAIDNIRLVQSMSQSKVLESTKSSPSDRELDPTRTGLLSLSDAVASLGLSLTPEDSSYPPTIDYVTSSLGNLSQQFTQQLLQAICGRLDPTQVAPAKKTAKKTLEQSSQSEETINDRLNIYFPSHNTVSESRGGLQSAGTICFQKDWWSKNDLIRQSLRDCIGVRNDGILMHSKIMYVRFKQPMVIEQAGTRVQCHGWVYLGSANLSESAW